MSAHTGKFTPGRKIYTDGVTDNIRYASILNPTPHIHFFISFSVYDMMILVSCSKQNCDSLLQMFIT